MWIAFAFGSAFFAGVTSILAKSGIRKTDSTVATAIRTIIVLIFSWIMVFITGSQNQLGSIGGKTLLFLILSGIATGTSWLCYFKALQLGDINKVVPIDKSSTVLTILLAVLLLGEPIGLFQGIGVLLMGAGTFLMIEKKAETNGASVQGKGWMLYAFGSAIFASLTSILGKIGIEGVESNLGTAIRTAVVLVMAWIMVLVTGKAEAVREIPGKELSFICLSGLATGGSWLCYYRALQDGLASVVVPIDKLSILVTVAFSWLVFHEKLTVRSGWGLVLIVAGTLAMIF
ncbi:MAG TPA: EamA family transporter [Candidatus Blautia faecigallinarum]|uniref:EamA family transporter n=1 Tax=Candidatus Blautia faecigallinarum TaxID=2838488 RepID=A0A9D2ITM1_9FIRM|nr:EamA family transporter [Candidatus Blautia faecigallinarum]